MNHLENYCLDKNTPVPLYYQLKQCIIRMIEEGILQVGDMLPTENELCDHLGISRPTVRQALNELMSEGLVTRQKGRGSFVSRPKIDARFFQKLESFNQEMRQKGLVPSTKILGLEKINGIASVNKRLQLELDAPLIHLTRLRFANGEPVVYLETFLPFDKFPTLLTADFESKSLYIQMEAEYGQWVSKVHREIEAVNATRAEADLLEIDPGKAVCLVKTIAYTQEEVPVEYSVARYRGDRNKFSVDLYR